MHVSHTRTHMRACMCLSLAHTCAHACISHTHTHARMHVSYSANLAMSSKKAWTRPKVIHVNEVRRPLHVPVDVAPTAISAIFNQPMAPVPSNETLHARPHPKPGGSVRARETGDMAAMAKQAQAAARRGSSEVCACGGGSRGGCVRVCVVAPAPRVSCGSAASRGQKGWLHKRRGSRPDRDRADSPSLRIPRSLSPVQVEELALYVSGGTAVIIAGIVLGRLVHSRLSRKRIGNP